MIFRLVHQEARNRARQALQAAPDGYVVTIKEPTRNLEQNAALWAALTDVSNQVEWYGRMLHQDDWKHIFTAALTKQEVVPNLDNTGFVVLGQSTSKMTAKQFSDLLELIYAFGAEHNVKWSNNGLET